MMTINFNLVKPWIDKSSIKVVKLKVGQPFELNLRYRAEPDPEVKWFAGETVRAYPSLPNKRKHK